MKQESFFPVGPVLVVNLLLLVVTKANGQTCSRTELVPAALSRNHNEYPYAESGLQIFTHLRFPCEGSVTSWTFYARVGYVLQLHLAVVREKTFKVYEIVGDTYIDSFRVSSQVAGSDSWLQYMLRTPIQVRPGDSIALFYDTFEIAQSLITIASRELYKNEWYGMAPTLVLLSGGNEINPGKIDATYAIETYRIPALFATVVPKNTALGPAQSTQPPFNRHEAPSLNSIPTPAVIRQPKYDAWQPRTEQPWAVQPPVNWIAGTTTPSINAVKNARCLKPASTFLVCERFLRRRRAYFDYTRNMCIEYDGCPPPSIYSGNNFESRDHCIQTCHPWNPIEVCSQRPSSLALCSMESTRFYFDALRNRCGIFTGCSSGNGLRPENNFESAEACSICTNYSSVYQFQLALVPAQQSPIAVVPVARRPSVIYLQQGPAVPRQQLVASSPKTIYAGK